MQRLWLTAVAQGLGLHPLTFLPYAFARVVRGGEGLAPATRRGLEDLRHAYARLLDLAGFEGEVLLFRLFPQKDPPPASVRRPIESVVRFLPA